MTYIEAKTANRSRWVRWLWGLDIEIEKIEASKPRRPLSWVEGGCVLTPEPRFRLVPLRVKALLFPLYLFGLIGLVNCREPLQRFGDSVARLFGF